MNAKREDKDTLQHVEDPIPLIVLELEIQTYASEYFRKYMLSGNPMERYRTREDNNHTCTNTNQQTSAP